MQEWIETALKELDRLTEHDIALGALDASTIQKRRDTILALVDARINSVAEETVWRRKDTCNRDTYHSKWKKDPPFDEALKSVTRIARDWKSREALSYSAFRLAAATEKAADKVVALIDDADPKVALQASFGILDRNQQTSKASQRQQIDHIVANLDYSKLTMEQLNRIEAGEDILKVILDGYRAPSASED